MDFLYDPIRQRQVANTPEERVRQATLRWLIEVGGYPQAYLMVERGLNLFHVSSSRRLDIACLEPGHVTQPGQLYLLIECKASLATTLELERAKRQVLGYHWQISPLVSAIVHEKGSCYCLHQQAHQWHEGLPTFSQLQSLRAPTLPPS